MMTSRATQDSILVEWCAFGAFICQLNIVCVNGYLTIIPRARMGYESIAHEAEGRVGY